MCGIVGRVNFNGHAVSAEILKESAYMIHTRGPDDSGVWSERGCGLAHRRLSILDLTEAGHQPMISSDGRYVCVFNGEIYNFQDLRNELGDNSFSWKGHSDTEVLLEGWARWGTDLLDRIDGMFAFVIWDKYKRKLFAARDRMGEKPFYYHWDGQHFGFSSRPTPLFKLFPGLSVEYDEQALRLFLESGYIPAPYSAHKEIQKLQAAHYLEVDNNGVKIQRYWDLRIIQPAKEWVRRSEEDLLDELDGVLLRSVEKRMVSDVPLGAFLSGGIDSSLMVAMMAKNSSSPIKTFTIGFEEKAYDESSDARVVANYLGTDHYCQHLCVNNLLDLLPNFLNQYDEPFFDSAAFPTMAVSKLARQHVTVSITGDGGDELFGGYHYYQIARLLNPFFSIPTWMRGATSRFVGLIPKHNFKLLSAALKQPNSARAFAFSRSIAKDFRNILSNDVLNRTIGLGDLFEQEVAEFPSGLHASEEGMRLDSLYTLNDDYLQKTDVASMAYSLESRAPILAREVVEWGMRLPVNWKVRGTGNKYLLRKLAYRYIPKEILDRPKRGFGVPIDSWLRGTLNKWAEARINDPSYFEGLPLKQEAVQSLFKLHKSGTRNVHPLLWAVLMLLEFNSRSRSD
ncbi:MAG: asparagine synthase (glutamine-hydrolyzing) [Desulfobulbaceae bacterium]|nr:asparagine synthase (glutamine-hydrolyzing) [Desulfobulbaceae bacterium]